MSKIAKLIAKALNNSNTQEAAQSLKMAAGYMAKEDVNPSLFLQCRGEEQPKGSTSTEELREAKRLAVYWCNKAEALELDLDAVKNLSNQWQSLAINNHEKVSTLRKWAKGFGIATGILTIFCAALIYVNQDLQEQKFNLSGKNYTLQKDNALLNDQLFELKHNSIKKEVAPAPVAVPKVEHEFATCKIQGLKVDTTKPGSKPKHIKFWFNDGTVSLYANNKLVNSGFDSTTREMFLREVNKAFPGEADCKLGVLN